LPIRGPRRTRSSPTETERPFAARGVYVNDLGDEGEDRIREAFGTNYDRLTALKARYDPTNLFRPNQNIKPGR
jgi:FAD/FMN-containing dehydrogenase